MSKKESFEASLAKLEEIIEQLEDPEVPLEKSLKLFEYGINKVQFCEKKLSEAEAKIEKVTGQFPHLKKETIEI